MKFLASFALVLILFGLSAGAVRFWDTGSFYISPSGSYSAAAGSILFFVSFGILMLKGERFTLRDAGNPYVWTSGLLLVFVTDWLCRSFVFFQGPSIRGELILAFLVALLFARRMERVAFIYAAIACSFLLVWSFGIASRGALLFSDDHAMFLFRLELLKGNFPFIPFWSPLWNAGFDARDFFATGALNVFFLSAPLLYAFDVTSIYNVVVSGILWVLVPLASYLAARVLGGTRRCAGIAALLSVCTGLAWYKWGLKYGTMGFITSGALMPLVVALLARFLTRASLGYIEIFATVIVTSLMLLWSPSGIALLPLGLFFLMRSGFILGSKKHVMVILLLAAINVPWMYTLWRVSSVGRFLNSHNEAAVAPSSVSVVVVDSHIDSTLQEDTAIKDASASKPTAYRHKSAKLNVRRSIDLWQEAASAMNPLIIFLGVPAIIALPVFQRRVFGSISTWLLFLGTVAVPLMPQLELDRMVVLASVLLCYPVARLLDVIFTSMNESRLKWFAGSLAGSFLFISPFAASSIVLNRSWERYSFLSPGVATLVDTIHKEATGGRVVFSGCVLHELSGGHLGPLAIWSESPLVASSYAHNIWRYEQVFPKSYLEQGDAGINRYLDDVNATVVTAHEPYWRDYFSQRPDRFREIWRGEGFILFKRLGIVPSYVYEGEARELSQNTNSVTLTPVSDHVVLKFRYFPFLKATGCTIRPFVVAPELELIELTNCTPGTPITIESSDLVTRLFSKG